MANLKLKTSEILRAIGMVASISRDPENDWDAQTHADVRQIIRDGIRLFENPPNGYQWAFRERPFVESASAPYETGTITVSAGTATLSGGIWPAWAEDGIIRVDGHTLYVTDRTSDTVCTVDNDAVAVEAGTAFVIHRYRFAMPDDFGEFIGGVTYEQANRARMLSGVDVSQIRRFYAANFRVGQTKFYALQAGSASDASKWYFHFWPTMDSESLVAATYRSVPEDLLDDDDLTGADEIHIEQVHSGTLLAAIRASAELYYNDQKEGPHYQDFLTRLAASIAHDKRTRGPIHPAGMTPEQTRRMALLYHVPTYEEIS